MGISLLPPLPFLHKSSWSEPQPEPAAPSPQWRRFLSGWRWVGGCWCASLFLAWSHWRVDYKAQRWRDGMPSPLLASLQHVYPGNERTQLSTGLGTTWTDRTCWGQGCHMNIRSTVGLTCSAEMSRTSWRAFSMPSLVPVILIWLLASSGRGIWILVAVFSSKSCSFSPFLPITKRWCSLGMATVAEAYNR